jgi:D-serine deaminase-like pyridoxal phosphate-dependent protein
MTLSALETPALLLDRARLEQNLERMRAHVHGLCAVLRPHVKTAKSIDVARRALAGEPGGITVSTLKEAEYFAAQGVRDILYAVGIAPAKFAHAIELIRDGVKLSVIADNLAVVGALASAAQRARVTVPVLIELDVDGHRSGVLPQSSFLIAIAKALNDSAGVELGGVLTHAGGSYDLRGAAAIADMAERERRGTVLAAEWGAHAPRSRGHRPGAFSGRQLIARSAESRVRHSVGAHALSRRRRRQPRNRRALGTLQRLVSVASCLQIGAIHSPPRRR